MTRALTFTFTCLLTLVGVLGAEALAKPKIAVLGLEILNPSGQALDAATPLVANELTGQLRARARFGSGNYDLAGNGEKELVDEKLINTCDTELPSCMAPIGGAIGASYLLYGHIKKEGSKYIVDLQLLNVNTKAKEKQKTRIELPVADATDTAKLQAFAKQWYAYLTSESITGKVIIKVSNKDAERGTVLLDGNEKGFLSSGRLELDKVNPGPHKLAIEVGNFQKFEQEITIVSGDTTEVPVTLEKNPGGISPDMRHEVGGTVGDNEKPNYWRPTFVAGGVIALAGATFWTYAYLKETDAEGRITSQVKNGTIDRFAGPSDCNGSSPRSDITWSTPSKAAESADALGTACTQRNHTKIGIAATSVGAVIMIGTFYVAWLRDKDNHESSATTGRTRSKKPTFAVTPIVSGDGGGATLRIDW